jgi:hypothetical protein
VVAAVTGGAEISCPAVPAFGAGGTLYIEGFDMRWLDPVELEFTPLDRASIWMLLRTELPAGAACAISLRARMGDAGETTITSEPVAFQVASGPR